MYIIKHTKIGRNVNSIIRPYSIRSVNYILSGHTKLKILSQSHPKDCENIRNFQTITTLITGKNSIKIDLIEVLSIHTSHLGLQN